MNLRYFIADQVDPHRASRRSAQVRNWQSDERACWTSQFESSRHHVTTSLGLKDQFDVAEVIDSGCPQKLTIANFRNAMQASKSLDWQLQLQGCSTNRELLLGAFKFLAGIPDVQETNHTAVPGKLTKEVSRHASIFATGDSSRPLRRSV